MTTAARTRSRYPQDRHGGRWDGVALLSLLVGGLLIVVSFFVSTWFTFHGPDSGTVNIPFNRFGDLYYGGFTKGWASVYFDWVGYALAALAVSSGLASFMADRSQRALRALSCLAAIAASGLAFPALQLNRGRTYAAWIGDLGSGLWVLIGGSALIAIGMAVEPRRTVN